MAECPGPGRARNKEWGEERLPGQPCLLECAGTLHPLKAHEHQGNVSKESPNHKETRREKGKEEGRGGVKGSKCKSLGPTPLKTHHVIFKNRR